MKKLHLFSLLTLLVANIAFAQVTPCNCSASAGSGNVNFSSLTWSGSGCPTAAATSYTGNLCIDLANGTNLIMDKNFTISGPAGSGGLGLSNNGNSTFSIPSGRTLTISGNMGDDSNNNVTFNINGNLVVGGGIYGKNSNAFDANGTGTGSITANSLVFVGNPSCLNPANCTGITWNVTNCSPSGTFCTTIRNLPVDLLYFDATASGNTVNLKWATASEKNASHFVIERSSNGLIFEEIEEVSANGNSLKRINYSTSDKNPLIGRNYYRLKQVDFDGKTETFNIEVIDFAGEKSISVYPNPANRGNVIQIKANFTSESLTGSILDMSGAVLHRFTFSGNTFTTNNLELNSGSYIVKVNEGFSTMFARFVVH